jgi:uncharacterized protein YndB with AHSA1/START domain
MHEIKNSIEITASPARVLEALTTKAGILGWWTVDADVGDREAAFRFDKPNRPMEVNFAIERKVVSGVAMVCTRETNNADWLGTHLTFGLTETPKGTRVDLLHAGYRAKNESYEMCTKGWAFYLGSLKSYLETGHGEPYQSARA